MVELWSFHFWSFWATVEFAIIMIMWYKFDKRIEKLKQEIAEARNKGER